VKGSYTQIVREGGGIIPTLDEFRGVEDHNQTSQDLAYLTISRGKLIQGFGLLEFELFHPV